MDRRELGSHSHAWTGYAACAWCCVFAAMSFYWALGGTAGLSTVSPELRPLVIARDPGFITILWITGVLKLIGGVFALALVRPWSQKLPRTLLLAAGWGGTVVLLIHGGDFLLRGVLWMSGVVSVPESVSASVIYGYTFLWGPWWLLGGILFGVTTLYYQRGVRSR